MKYGAWSVLIDGKDHNVFFPNKDGCYGVPQMTLGQYRLSGHKTHRKTSMDCIDPWLVCLLSVKSSVTSCAFERNIKLLTELI